MGYTPWFSLTVTVPPGVLLALLYLLSLRDSDLLSLTITEDIIGRLRRHGGNGGKRSSLSV